MIWQLRVKRVLWCFQRGEDDQKSISNGPAASGFNDDWLGVEWEADLVGWVWFSGRVGLDPSSHHFSSGKDLWTVFIEHNCWDWLIWIVVTLLKDTLTLWVNCWEMMALMSIWPIWYHADNWQLLFTLRRNFNTRGTTATTLGFKTESFMSRKLVFSL